MSEPEHSLDLTQETESQGLPASIFLSLLLQRGLRQLRSDSWATAAHSLSDVGEPLFRASAEGRDSCVFEAGDVLVHVALFNGWVYAEAAGMHHADARAATAALRDKLPPPDPASSHEVNVTFWTYSPQGAIPSARSISVPEWSDIERNYAAATRQKLDRLMRSFEPAHGGQLVLWHGKPGTGKTFALRSLAWEWREWCEIHYIVDPDSFFGQHADYLMGVLTQPASSTIPMGLGSAMMHMVHLDELEAADGQSQERAWRLIVLEDTGELLTPDAKTVIGQGLSRFLNVVDGLIGQGLRVLVLVTTNEEIRTLHPAVARPGRAAANVEFTALTAEEAASWLAERGSEATADRAIDLASLYGLVEGFEPGVASKSAGFAT